MSETRPLPKQIIPVHAELKFSGVIYDAYQWSQTMYDGRVATFERLKMKFDVASIFPITEDKQIILTKQMQPAFAKPFIANIGGIIENGEDPFAAAKREMAEESGYTSDQINLWYVEQPSDSIDFAKYVYIAKNAKKTTQQQLDGGEEIELIYLDFDKFLWQICQSEYRNRDVAYHILANTQTPELKQKLTELFLG